MNGARAVLRVSGVAPTERGVRPKFPRHRTCQSSSSSARCLRVVSSASSEGADASTRVETLDRLAAFVRAGGGRASVTRVGEGARGRGLFAARDISAGEAVVSVPLSIVMSDDAMPEPYPGAPWSVTLAAALLTQQRLGAASDWAAYVSSLPKETIGWANSPEAGKDRRDALGCDAAAEEEMERYATLVDGSHRAMTMMHHGWSAEEWRWAMSQVHSRTFRVETRGGGEDLRVMVPWVDLLNHDSREDVWQCEWGAEWGGDGKDRDDGAFVVRAARDIAAGEELLISYGERSDRHFLLFYGFLPDPNPHNAVALFDGLEEAAAWYEELCGEEGEDAARRWAALRSRAVAQVCAEERRKERKAAGRAEDEDDDAAGRGEAASESWTSAEAEAQEAATLNIGVGASVDERLLRLFELLCDDPDMAVAAVRVRAAQLLDAYGGDENDVEENAEGASEAARLSSGYRARRKALLLEIA